ncbi:hypothetical protein MMARV_C051P2, partial [viral metagenome]
SIPLVDLNLIGVPWDPNPAKRNVIPQLAETWSVGHQFIMNDSMFDADLTPGKAIGEKAEPWEVYSSLVTSAFPLASHMQTGVCDDQKGTKKGLSWLALSPSISYATALALGQWGAPPIPLNSFGNNVRVIIDPVLNSTVPALDMWANQDIYPLIWGDGFGKYMRGASTNYKLHIPVTDVRGTQTIISGDVRHNLARILANLGMKGK